MGCQGEPGCGNKVVAKGLCGKHYQRLKKYGSTDESALTTLPPGAPSRRDALGRKLCSACRNWLPVENFSLDKVAKDGLRRKCKKCRASELLKSSRRIRFKLSTTQIESMLAEQGYQCPICLDVISIDTCHVDHDHDCCPSSALTCGACIRGLLCDFCNHGLGRFKDDPKRLRRAARYLDQRKIK